MERLFTNQKLSAVQGGVSNSNRVISLLLSFALLLSMMPQMLLFPAFSVESDSASGTADYSAELGKIAVFNTAEINYFPFMESKPAGDWEDSALQLSAEDISADLVLEIKDYYVLEASYSSLWYQVTVVSGSAPEGFGSGCWVFQDYLGEDAYGVDSLILSEPPKVTDEATGVTVTGVLPEGAELSVEIPEIDGEALPGLFDIKIYKEDGTEWQPIDEGRKVTISIPVEGDVATVTHFVDYAAAIHDDLTFESVEGADDAVLDILKPAIDAYEKKYSSRDFVAVEEYVDYEVSGGVVTVETDSFSLWNFEGEDVQQGALFLNIGEGTAKGQVTGFDAATQENGVWDNGLYYIPTEGGGVPEEGKLRIQAAWADVATETYYEWYEFTADEVETSAKITVVRVSAAGALETIVDNVTMTAGWTGEIYDSGNKRGIALYDIPLDTNPDSGDRYTVTINDGNGNIATIQFIVADLDTEYTMTFEDPYGVLEALPTDNPVNYVHADKVAIPGATAVDGYEFSHWILREPAGQWEDIKYYPGDDFQYKIGNVVFIPQVTPNYKYEIKFVTDVDASGMPEDKATDWLPGSTYTAEWDTTPVAEDSEHYTFMGWSVSTGGTLADYEQQLTVTGTPASTVTVTLTAVWKHSEDKQYTVEHYYETLESGVYELVEVETLYGIEGNVTAAKANNPVGFTAPATVTQEVITGDTTIVKIYYTRNTYKATWYVDGDVYSGPEEYKYGAPIVLPTTPSKTGYVFDRWDGYTEGMTMPASDWGFSALWHLATLAIYFDSMGGTAVAPIVQPYGSTVTAPTPPEKTGHTFAGWYEDQALTQTYTFTTMPAESITLYAKWSIIFYNVSYDTNSSVTISGFDDQKFEYNASAAIHSSEPAWEGHTFLGWECNIDGCTICSSRTYHDPGTSFTMPAKDVILTAQWNPEPFELTYTGDGITEETLIVDFGSEVTIKENPKREGYTFAGWEGSDGEIYWGGDLFVMPARPFALTAKWTPIGYTVTFAGGDVANATLPSDLSGKHVGDEITLGAASATGYQFKGWMCDVAGCTTLHTAGSTFTMPASNVVLTAQWTVNTYTVIWDAGTNGGTVNGQNSIQTTHDFGTLISLPNYRPVKEGYIFAGWYTQSSGGTKVETNSQTCNGNITFYAQFTAASFTQTVKVRYQNADGTWGDYQTVTENVNYGESFTWSRAADAIYQAASDVSYTVTGEQTTLVDVYRQQYTVTLTAGTGIDSVSQTVTNGAAVSGKTNTYYAGSTITVNATVKNGYAWENWTQTSSGVQVMTTQAYIIDSLSGDIAYTANATTVEYTISYNLDGGSVATENPTEYTVESGDIVLVNPTKEGYVFLGWTGTGLSEVTETVTIPTGSSGNREYTAVWGARLDVSAGYCKISVSGSSYDNSYAENYALGAMKGQQIVVTPENGYRIVGVTVDGVAVTIFDDSSYTYTVDASNGLTENTKIVVTTEKIMVTVKIVIGEGADAKVIEVQKGSDILIAITPHEGTLISVQKNLGGSVTSITENITNGYIFTATNISSDVTLTVSATSSNVHYAVGAIENGTVTLEYTDNGNVVSVNSKDSISDHAGIPHFVDYTITLNADSGYTISEVITDSKTTTVEEIRTEESLSGSMTGDQVIIAETLPTYTITYNVDGGDSAVDAQIKIHGTNISLHSAPTRTGYTFDHWLGSDGNTYEAGSEYTTDADITLTAVWKINQYQVTWVDGDGNTLKTEQVNYGETPVYTGETPTKTATDQYTYMFNNTWSPAVVPVTGNVIYTAQFDSTTRKYPITFVDEDGTELQSSEVAYGETPAYTGETPTKAATAQYTYTFAGWTPAISEVTGAATYTATYTAIINQYTISFDADGGAAVKSVTKDYNGSFTAPSTTKEGYAFAGWAESKNGSVTYKAGDIITVTGNKTLYAVWTANQFTITFKLGNGESDIVHTLNYGAAVSAPSDPTKTGYTFTGWDKAIPATMPAEDITITAQWKINQYTITFVTGGGTSIAAITLDYGAAVTAPEDPTKRGYVFDGWDKAIPATMPAQNITITAKWTIRVQIGINMAYYMVGNDYYHTLPQTPTKLTNFPSVRAYFQNGAWVLTSTRGDYDHDVGRDFNLNIESLLEDHPIPSSDGTYGVLDPTGAPVKTYFNFSSDKTTDNGVYNALIEAWLGRDHSGMNMEIDWSKVKADDCSIIPYVVKLQDDGIWYVDMLVLVEKTSLTISVEDSDEVDSSHAFVYQISSDGMDTLTVVVRKDAPVTVDGLFIGKEYTVTQVADWSWKYSDKPDWSFEAIVGNESFTATGTGTLSAAITVRGGSNQLIFKQSLNDPGWLGGEGSSDQP